VRRALALLLVVVAGCGGDEPASTTELHLEPGCRVTAGPCTAAGEGLHVELQLPPTPATLKPMEVKVRIAGAPVEPPLLELSMIGMDMGDNRYRLLEDGPGAWRATVVLPVCTRGRADWTADVTFSTHGVRYRARFPFSTGE
jgi:hypothetical protein